MSGNTNPTIADGNTDGPAAASTATSSARLCSPAGACAVEDLPAVDRVPHLPR